MDCEQIIRVGGRLRNTTNPFDAKHQMLLPKDHQITTTLIRHFHQENGHCGPHALTAVVHQAFWPLGARGLVRKVTRGCVICFKARPITTSPPMGDLPATRTTQCHPFLHTGVDYAGPLTLKLTRRASTKAYVAVFICMATKAVHLEIVSDASTLAFIAALHRFVSRRGLCQNLYSDNGTNFVGASSISFHRARRTLAAYGRLR
jgi:Integrase zinc binding domain